MIKLPAGERELENLNIWICCTERGIQMIRIRRKMSSNWTVKATIKIKKTTFPEESKFPPSRDLFSSNFDSTASIPSQIYETIFQKYFKNSLKHQHFAFRQNPDSHQQSIVMWFLLNFRNIEKSNLNKSQYFNLKEKGLWWFLVELWIFQNSHQTTKRIKRVNKYENQLVSSSMTRSTMVMFLCHSVILF